MKFSEYPYHTIDVKQAKDKFRKIESRLVNAEDYASFKQAFKDLDVYKKELYTQFSLCEVRHTIDTRDEYYKKEQEHIDEIAPILQENLVRISNVILESPYRKELEKEIPSTYFLAKEFDKKCFSPDIIEELQKENQYSSQYQQLVASAQIEFEGKKRTLSELEPFMKASDRSMRKKATKAYWGWFEKYEEELGEIFDSLVKIRTTMAQKLGYKDYTEMGYYRMYRFDYTKEDVQTYHKQVLDTVVPVTASLFARQQKRLGLDALYAWDEKVEFQSGNPTPKQDARTMVKIALHMYQELDKDTGEFFQFMVDHFQHEIYAHPEYTHAKRMETWRKLEKMYLPHKNYDEIDVLERGGWWMRQLHIFMDPFYYIDYTLAQVCALQFWIRAQKKDPSTLKDYKKICKLGGSLPFRKIVQAANLKSPFEEGCLNETMKEVQNALNAITDEELQ